MAYLRKHNLYVRPLSGGQETQITKDKDENLLNGEVDWVYAEEVERPQPLFLVACGQRHRLLADGRDPGAQLPHRRLAVAACHVSTCRNIRSPVIPTRRCESE